MKNKICYDCKKEKPTDCFSKDKKSKDELSYRCKDCNIRYLKTYYEENKEQILKQQSVRYELIKDTKKSKDYSKKYYQLHKKEIKMYPSNNPNYKKDKYLQRTFGMTLEQYKQMSESQNGVCAICNQPETTVNKRGNKIQYLSVDHNHKSGKVRGLLCRKCNRILGDSNENIEILNSATNYLNLHRE